MKGERILIADDQDVVIEGVEMCLEAFATEDDQKIVGKAHSVEEVKKLLKDGLRPTLALVDNRFPVQGEGEAAARIIKKLSPDTYVIAFSSDICEWGDAWWHKHMGGRELTQALRELQH